MEGTGNFLRVGKSTWGSGPGCPVGDYRDARKELAVSLDRGADDEDTDPSGWPGVFGHLPIIGQRASLRRVRHDQRMHQLIHCRGWGKIQLAAEHSLIFLVVPHRGSPITLSEVDADDDPVGAFAE